MIDSRIARNDATIRRYTPRPASATFTWGEPLLRFTSATRLVAVAAGCLIAGCTDLGDSVQPDPGPGGGTQRSVTLSPTRDNTLYETLTGDRSNGAGPFLFVGRTGLNAGQVLRRAAIAFDVAAALPAGATIDGATLTLHLSNVSIFGGPSTIALHRLLADWGEGDSDTGVVMAGAGAPAAPGDVTWRHTFFDTDFWATPGGDFDPSASASTIVRDLDGNDAANFYEWSGSGLARDLQAMLDDPAGNFGWILIGDETTDNAAKGFHTKEHPTAANRPRLVVRYTEAP